MINLKVDDVLVAEKPLTELNTKEAIERLIRRNLEACSDPYGKLIPSQFHALVEASHKAYDDHRPLVLSPDMIWLTIAQGIANHVNNNSEELRKEFVSHEGKLLIEIRRDDFIKGSMDNPWPEVFGQFSAKIKEKMNPGSYDGVTASFSTTGSIERAAGDIIFMDMVKNYFQVFMRTCCGIPEVTLEGTAEDWVLIRDKVESLKSKYGLEWWLKELYPVVSGMADCASGKQDGTFLKEWYKLGGGSGGPYVSGHILKFFPYLKDRNGEAKRKVENFNPGVHFGGPNTDAFTAGLNSVPFIWQYYGDLKNMRLSAGFVGYTQDQQTMAVRPKIGWAVYEEDAPIISEFVRTCVKCEKQKMMEEFMPFGDGTVCMECY